MAENDLNNLLTELKTQGITDNKVLEAIKAVPRDEFLPEELKYRAFENRALPIGCKQTISQPYIVALMTQAALLFGPVNKVLEIGTGSGYQAAILSKLCKQVFTIERHAQLQEQAKIILDKLKLANISYKIGDGSKGWKENAPYDAILVTAAANPLPEDLLEQLSPNHGKLVIPLGSVNSVQRLILIVNNNGDFKQQFLESVSFVPLISDD